ncbi:MAG: regulatory protein RecX [Pseudomonadota bacterium]|nr:regulatory protein RecX [Pseudomonadota bacterium]
MKLLSAREHSRLELARKLMTRGYAQTAVDEVLGSLREQGLLSEERMTESYVAERLRKGFGPLRVRQELRQRGIPDALIESHLERSSHEWLELIAAVHEKKFGPDRTADARELARRARFLEYRGFPSELILRFLRGHDEP